MPEKVGPYVLSFILCYWEFRLEVAQPRTKPMYCTPCSIRIPPPRKLQKPNRPVEYVTVLS